MIPVYKIEVYDQTPTLRYTITGDAFNIRTEKVLTNNVGTFSFMLPADKGGVPLYYDIALFDSVQIYFGWDSVGASPDFVGRVYQIQGTQTAEGGTVRLIKGRDQGEVLLRRFKGMSDWVDTEADDIVAEIASDLSLGAGDIAVDTTAENHRIDIDKHERYFDFLKKVSDYWKDAGTQVKKDFHIDADGDLYWAARPIRSSGVETITEMKSYLVLRDLKTVKNKIWVYGKRGKPHDATLDDGTDMATPDQGNTTVDVISASAQKVLSVAATAPFSASDTVIIYDIAGSRYEKNTVDSIAAGVSLTMVNNLANTYQVGDICVVYPGWFATYANNTLGVDAANKKVGSRSITTTAAAASHTGFAYYPTSNFNFNYFPRLNFYYLSTTSTEQVYVRLYDTSVNSAVYEVGNPDVQGARFKFAQIPAGRDNENSWIIDSGFDWTDVWSIDWTGYGVVNGDLLIDGLYLDNRRYSDTAENAASQSSYGVQEMVVVDDDLKSDADCQRRGEALLFQLKDPVIRADVEVNGNTNILVGDRLSLTISAENISAANYDVIKVNHVFDLGGFRTIFTAVDTSSSRLFPPRNYNEFLSGKFQEQRDIGRGLNVLK